MAAATSTPFGAPTVGDVCPRYVQLGYIAYLVYIFILWWMLDFLMLMHLRGRLKRFVRRKILPTLLHFLGYMPALKRLASHVDPAASYWMVKFCALVNSNVSVVNFRLMQDKAVKRFLVRNIVEQAAVRDVQEACVYDGKQFIIISIFVPRIRVLQMNASFQG